MHMISMCLIKLMLKLSDNCTYICTCKLRQSVNVHHAKLLVQYCNQYINSDLGFPIDLMVKICLPSRRCGFNPWVNKIPWKRKWQLTPVFLPRKSHGQGILLGYSPWVCKRVRCNSATKQQQILIVIQSQYRIIPSPQETPPHPVFLIFIHIHLFLQLPIVFKITY